MMFLRRTKKSYYFGSKKANFPSYRNHIALILCSFLAVLFLFASCSESSKVDDNPQMAKILQEINNDFENGGNLFANNARIKYFDSLLVKNSNNYDVLYLKGIDLLRAGYSEEAVNIFHLLSNTDEKELLQGGMNQNEIMKTHYYLGLSYLRIGEQENCILNHTSASCIIPISKEGFHQKETGSRQALTTFSKILEEQPDELSARWLLNIAYMTLGEYPASVPEKWLIPLTAFQSDYRIPKFIDRATDIGFDIRGLAGGLVVDDLDNDSYLDILVSEWGPTDSLHYLHNNGDGTFSDLTETAGISAITGGLNMIHADYNNDGYLDIFILRGAWLNEFGKQPNSLLRNNGDNTFSDVTISSGLLSFHPTQSATWNDFNNDGWVDLFIGNESNGTADGFHFSELYINNQDGTFTESASKAGIRVNIAGFRLTAHYIKGVTSGDYNNDGWQDIYVSTGVFNREQNFLFKNNGLDENGAISFTDVTKAAGLDGKRSTFSTWFWDYNNDGWLDIFASSYFRGEYYGSIMDDLTKEYLGQNHKAEIGFLFKNKGDGTFENVSEETGLNKILYAMGANFGDLDNDGFLDMYLGTGNIGLNTVMPNKMFRNVQGKGFQDVTTAGGFGNIQKGHGVAFADIDHDGDQDILISMGGAFEGDIYQNTFYENPYMGSKDEKNWVAISLRGETSNRYGVGCRIILEVEEDGVLRKIFRDVTSGGSFGSSPLRQHIGLGNATEIKRLVIQWTHNNTQQFENLVVNKYYTITENQSSVKQTSLEKIDFNKHTHEHKHKM